jgi:hypothetical protein
MRRKNKFVKSVSAKELKYYIILMGVDKSSGPPDLIIAAPSKIIGKVTFKNPQEVSKIHMNDIGLESSPK